MKRHRSILLPSLLLSVLVSGVSADVLLVDRVQRGSHAAVPNRGTVMSQVEALYGAPEQKFDAVGQPPITRWVYPGFTVYFEHSHVIHAVLNKSAPTEKGPRPAQ